jgi:uncharacterized membrane protein
MRAPRGPLRRFFDTERPSLDDATAALRLVFLGLFGAQVLVALALGLGVALMMPVRPRPNDAFAIVLVGIATLHLPMAWLLSRAATRAGGKQAALSATVVGAVLASLPAWFAALMMISAQRAPYLFAVVAVLSSGYALGFASIGAAARAATKPPPGGDEEAQ